MPKKPISSLSVRLGQACPHVHAGPPSLTGRAVVGSTCPLLPFFRTLASLFPRDHNPGNRCGTCLVGSEGVSPLISHLLRQRKGTDEI